MKSAKRTFVIFIFIVMLSFSSCSNDKVIENFGENIEGGVFNPSDNYSTIINNLEENGHYKLTFNFKNNENIFYVGNISGNTDVYDVPVYFYKFNDTLVFKIELNKISQVNLDELQKNNLKSFKTIKDFCLVIDKVEDCINGYFNKNDVNNKINFTITPYEIEKDNNPYIETASLGLFNDTSRLTDLLSPLKIEYIKGTNDSKAVTVDMSKKLKLNESVLFQKIVRNKYNEVSFNDVMLVYNNSLNESNTKLEYLYKAVEFSKDDLDTYNEYVKEYFKEVYNSTQTTEITRKFDGMHMSLYQVSDEKFLPCFKIETQNTIILFSWIQTGFDYLSVVTTGVSSEIISDNMKNILKP